MKRPRGYQFQQRRVFRVNGEVAAFPVAIPGEDMGLLVYRYAGPAGVQIKFAAIKKQQSDRRDMDQAPIFFQPRPIHSFNRGTSTPTRGKSIPLFFPFAFARIKPARATPRPPIRLAARNPKRVISYRTVFILSHAAYSSDSEQQISTFAPHSVCVQRDD